MARKFLFLFGVVLVSITVWLLLQQEQQVIAEPQKVLKKEIDPNTSSTVENQFSETGNSYDYLFPTIDNKFDYGISDKAGDYDLLLNEASSQEFSNDAYVEGFSIHLRATECDLLDGRFMQYQLNESAVGSSLLQKKQQNCKQWKSQFPMLSTKQMWTKKIAELPATSTVGRLIKQYPQTADSIERTQLSAEIFDLALKEKNPYLLSYIWTHSVFVGDYLTQEHKQNTTYFELVLSAAVDLLSCEFNQVEFCSTSSWLMINKCASNPGYCGQTYQQWFEQNFMPGMKQDVMSLLDHLRGIANEPITSG